MLIKSKSKYYLKKIRAKAKMYEYRVPESIHVDVEKQANDLIFLCIGIVGDIASKISDITITPIEISDERKDELYFAARFFDSYFQSKLGEQMNPYYVLMGAVTYYFCDMNGSSKVMMGYLTNLHNFQFSAGGLENIVMWLLDNNYKIDINNIDKKYRIIIDNIIDYHDKFFSCENPVEIDFNSIKSYLYHVGSDREILFIEIILAILKKKTYNSCIKLMPLFSEIDLAAWRETFKNNMILREMWTSQILLGKDGIFKGTSGVIQMPTSSGKTTSIALTIQSAFLAQRTSVVVIVAPFRALCKEIVFDIESFFSFDESISVTEFSDIPEESEINLTITDSISKKIFVMTPEKLAYILKQNKGIVEKINLIVFDEAHLFDDESRGTDYELLLTTINRYLKEEAQKILVSAVISNVEQLNAWINKDGVVIKNNTIKTAERTVAFNVFLNNIHSNLYFVDPRRHLEEEFFVPRVVQVQKLAKLEHERKQRYFPDLKNSKQDVGIYYAIKLVSNGSIAIFCSKKDSVNNILKRFIELKDRGVLLDDLKSLSDRTECEKISNLIKEHLGVDSPLYLGILNGIIGHHSGVPNGIRVAEEYALKSLLVKCIVCTSTLAQGVNLPIKYLIISNIYQSKKVIKTRDFHNLIGRTARAGKETEGTIILTEEVFKNHKNQYKLNNYMRILEPDNSEDCSSNLLKLVRLSDITQNGLPLDQFFKNYIISRYSQYEEYLNIKKYILKYMENGEKYGSEILYKMNEIDRILISLENFILEFLCNEDESSKIIQSTYGFYLATEEEKIELLNIFTLIKNNIDSFDVNERLLYKKSMLGIIKMKELSSYIIDNLDIISTANYERLVDLIADKLIDSENCKIVPKLIDNEIIKKLLYLWLNGESYIQILNYSKSYNLHVKRGKSTKEISLDDIITLCDYDFGYISLTIIQTIIEVLKYKDFGEDVQKELNNIICRIRYGLPNKESVYVYELGFADRIIAQKIAKVLDDYDCDTKKKMKVIIKCNKTLLEQILKQYPSYFLDRLKKI